MSALKKAEKEKVFEKDLDLREEIITVICMNHQDDLLTSV